MKKKRSSGALAGFNQKAYRGYLIRKNELLGDMWIEKDNYLIGRVPRGQSWEWAQKEIDTLLDPQSNPKRRKHSKMKKPITRTRKRKSVKQIYKKGTRAGSVFPKFDSFKAKPRTIRYKITAQNTGKRMHYDGRNFSERPTVKSFLTADAATTHARMLLRRFPRLRKYQVRVESFP